MLVSGIRSNPGSANWLTGNNLEYVIRSHLLRPTKPSILLESINQVQLCLGVKVLCTAAGCRTYNDYRRIWLVHARHLAITPGIIPISLNAKHVLIN